MSTGVSRTTANPLDLLQQALLPNLQLPPDLGDTALSPRSLFEDILRTDQFTQEQLKTYPGEDWLAKAGSLLGMGQLGGILPNMLGGAGGAKGGLDLLRKLGGGGLDKLVGGGLDKLLGGGLGKLAEGGLGKVLGGGLGGVLGGPGGPLGAVGSLFGKGMVTDQIGDLAATAIGTVFGGPLGGILGKAVRPLVGKGAGKLFQGVGQGLKKLFGRKKERRQARRQQAAEARQAAAPRPSHLDRARGYHDQRANGLERQVASVNSEAAAVTEQLARLGANGEAATPVRKRLQGVLNRHAGRLAETKAHRLRSRQGSRRAAARAASGHQRGTGQVSPRGLPALSVVPARCGPGPHVGFRPSYQPFARPLAYPGTPVLPPAPLRAGAELPQEVVRAFQLETQLGRITRGIGLAGGLLASAAELQAVMPRHRVV